MKTKNLLSVLAIMALCFNVASCSKTIDETPEEMEQAPKKAVSITTRSVSNATIEYPITLYAFNANGTLAASVTAEEADDALALELGAGSYKLVAMASTNGLTLPESPTASSVISIPEDGILGSPLQMGTAEVNITAEELTTNLQNEKTVDITLAYQVAKTSIKLTQIPQDATGVKVTLSPLYSNETFLGAFSGEKDVELTLSKEEGTTGTWQSPTVYTLPSVEGETFTITISITNGTISKSYDYELSTGLEAENEYNFIGSYQNSLHLTGTITANGWKTPQTVDFNFGFGDGNENGSETPTPDTPDTPDVPESNEPSTEEPEEEVYSVEEIPTAMSAWEGHFVANITYNDNKNADLLLISLDEWSDITQSTASITAENVINSYVENGIKNWRVPTSTELTTIFQVFYNSSIDAVNGKLQNDLSGKKITGDAFYLCDETTKAIKPGDSKKVLGLTTSDIYRLRLVKTVKVKKVATN